MAALAAAGYSGATHSLALTPGTRALVVSCSVSLLSVTSSRLAVSGSSPDRPARGQHSEGCAAVFVPAAGARQGGRLELHSGYPHISAWPETGGKYSVRLRTQFGLMRI